MPLIEGRAGTLYYDIQGPEAAPLLVLGNSLGTTTRLWDDHLPTLTARFRVVRFDLRGHGGSSAPPGPYDIADLGEDLLEVLDTVGASAGAHADRPEVYLAGVSIGGMIGMWLASHHPERVDGLVLACTAPWLGPSQQWHDRAAAVRAGGTGVMADALPQRWFTSDFRETEPDTVARVVAMLDDVDAEGYAGCCEAIASMDQRGDLHAIRARTLVVAGADDPATPPGTALELQSAIPGAALVVFAQASHLACLEHPRRFAAVVTEHLLGLPVHRGDRLRRMVLGDEHVDRAAIGASAFTAPMQDLITRSAWAEVWSRPGLEIKTRSCLTIGMLAALGRHQELEVHLRGAGHLGVTPAEIQEVLLQVAVYAGMPAANAAFRIADQVLGEGGRS